MLDFYCSNCGDAITHRVPIREGNNWDKLFCSLPCAWMDRKSEHDLDNLCKWLSLSEKWGNTSDITSLVRATLEETGRLSVIGRK